MAGKFKIFCDDCPTKSSFEPEDKLTNLTTHHQQQQQQQPSLATIKPSTTNAASTTNDLQYHQQQLQLQQQQEKFIALNATTGPLQPSKREPLGLRQPISQAQASSVVVEPGPAVASSSSLTNTSSVVSVNDEDQENDISMASLGSDFVPSIIHDDDHVDDYDDHSFEIEDEDEAVEYDDEPEYDDVDFDEELKLELSQAFKQHDESQLFKSTVFIDEIKSYLTQLERQPDLRPLPNYMDFQKDVNSDKRAILINWLVEVADEYNLQTETLFICIGIIDRFLSKMSVATRNFQLLGVAAMFIASKYEEIYPPNLYQFVEVTDDTYSGQQIRQMEQDILKALSFRISLPTVSFFLRQIFAFNKFSKKVYHLAEYLCYLSLLADQPFLEYYPSEIALAAVILAVHQLGAEANISPELRSAYDRSNIDQLQRRNLDKGAKLSEIDRRVYTINSKLPFCIESLRALQERAFRRSTRLHTDTAITQRFSSPSYSSVSLLPPPTVEDLHVFAY